MKKARGSGECHSIIGNGRDKKKRDIGEMK